MGVQDTKSFAFLVHSLDAGLKALDTNVSSQCATAIDSLAAYYFKHTQPGEQPTAAAQVPLLLVYIKFGTE